MQGDGNTPPVRKLLLDRAREINRGEGFKVTKKNAVKKFANHEVRLRINEFMASRVVR